MKDILFGISYLNSPLQDGYKYYVFCVKHLSLGAKAHVHDCLCCLITRTLVHQNEDDITAAVWHLKIRGMRGGSTLSQQRYQLLSIIV